MPTYQIPSTLTEAQIEADVAQYLAWCARGAPFRVLAVNEQETGADKLCDVTVPVYMQFKKSTGLRPWQPTGKPLRKNEGPLQEIRRFRRLNNLADNPSLYFQLRAKAKTAIDLQHNILLANHVPDRCYAVYVAPLTLDHKSYGEELFQGARYLDDPWIWKHSEIIGEADGHIWRMRFAQQPFLRNHITIAPHERVEDHNHYYAFSQTGDEVSWHSPEALDQGPNRLSDFMSLRIRGMFYRKELPGPTQGLEVARKVLEQIGEKPEEILAGDDSFDQLRSYGRWLHKTHGIFQMLLCGSRENLQSGSAIRV